jgi:Protein of unknown function (DUF1064)
MQKNKYGADRSGGYDSKGEGRLAQEIELLRRAGELLDVIEQAPFPLFGQNGSQVCLHRVDFLMVFRDGHPEVWEFKGLPTSLWKLKLRLFYDNYPGVLYVIRKKVAN